MSGNRYIPNSFQTPNVLIDEIMPFLTPQEWVVLSFAVRHILGWQDKIASQQANISLSRFENTGLSRPAIIKALDELERFGLLAKVGTPTDKGQCWQLSFDENVKIAAMTSRRFDQDKKNKQRTSKARSVGLTGQSDLPIVVNGTDRQVVSGTDTVKHKETQVTNIAPGGAVTNGKPIEPAPKPPKAPKPKAERKRDLVFDAVGEYIYKAPPGSVLATELGGWIGKTTAGLKKLLPTITPQNVADFMVWDEWPATATDKILLHFSAWLKESVSAPVPVAPPRELTDWEKAEQEAIVTLMNVRAR